MPFTIPEYNIRIPNIPLLNGQAPKVFNDELWDAIEEGTLLVHKEVRERTPVDTGRLRAGIHFDLQRGTSIANHRGIVGTKIKYALPVETGSVAHFPPVKKLRMWAKRKLGDKRLAFVVARAISKRGTKGAWMFRDGFAAAEPAIERMFLKAREQIARRLMRK